MNKYQLLEIVEYISIFTALAGSTIAVTTGEIIYATVPMALSLLLNLIRRSQFEQQFQQRVSRSTNETHQQILNNIQSLHTALITIYSQTNSEQFRQNIVVLSEKIDSLQTDIKNGYLDTNISQLQTQCQNLQDTLNGLIYRMLSCGVLSTYDAKPEEKGIANIVNQYQNYKQEYKKSYSVMLSEDSISDDLEDDS